MGQKATDAFDQPRGTPARSGSGTESQHRARILAKRWLKRATRVQGKIGFGRYIQRVNLLALGVKADFAVVEFLRGFGAGFFYQIAPKPLQMLESQVLALHRQLGCAVVAGDDHGEALIGAACGCKSLQPCMGGIQKAGHFLRCFAFDAHGQAKRTKLQIGHRAIEHLVEQVGCLCTVQRVSAVFAAANFFFGVVANAHGVNVDDG